MFSPRSPWTEHKNQNEESISDCWTSECFTAVHRAVSLFFRWDDTSYLSPGMSRVNKRSQPVFGCYCGHAKRTLTRCELQVEVTTLSSRKWLWVENADACARACALCVFVGGQGGDVELTQALLAWPYLQEVLLKLIFNSNKIWKKRTRRSFGPIPK